MPVKWVIGCLWLLVPLIGLTGCSSVAPQSQDTLTVYLVRHAEKMTGSSNPGLTPAGERRAAALRDRLARAEIDYIHSTNYRRTVETARPLAEVLGLEIAFYDPRNLLEFAEELRAQGGTHVVVGHSNTTPMLVQLLGGQGGPPIREVDEYDRLYILSVDGNNNVSSRIVRYGAR